MSSRMMLRHCVRTTYAVCTATAVIAIVLLWACSTNNVAAQGNVDPTPTTLVAQGTPSPQHQTTVLNRLWWRNLEEQDAFIHALFRTPLATANIGRIAGAVGSDGTSPYSDGHDAQRTRQQKQQRQGSGRLAKGRGIAHHAPANSTGPEKRLFIPKLHFVYTITNEAKEALEAQAAASTHVSAGGATTPTSAKSTGATYTQLLRSVLPLGFGGPTENVAKPLTPLQAAALHSPIAPLREFVLDDEEVQRSTFESHSQGATASPPDEVEAATTANQEGVEHAVKTVDEAAGELSPTTTADEHEVSSIPLSQKTNTLGSQHPLYQSQSSADETLIVVGSVTKAVVPLKVTGTSYTIVQFDGKEGNTINAVVQLKDHRYDASVSPSNCYNMYFKVELRNHVKTDSSDSGDFSTYATTQPHAYVDKSQWNSATGRAAAALNGGDNADRSNSDPDVSTATRGSWASFWDSFALMLDTSALCKVLPSVSMRVSKVQQTEPFYVVLRSTTGYAYDTAYYYNTTSGAFYTNTKDDDYTCELDLFIEQWPAAEQERLQFIFSFLVPLLVLLLPLPFTMRRADLVQQYMMETDYAEWVWRPPYYLRNRMIEGLKAMVHWAERLRTAHQQRALLTQLQRQQHEHHEQAQPSSAHSDNDQNSNNNSNRNIGDSGRGDAAAANCSSVPQLPSSTEASHGVTAGAPALESNERASLSQLHHSIHTHVTEGLSGVEDETGHRACTPHAQFKETASTASTTSSDESHLNRSSTRSTSGSDFDESLDEQRPHRRDSDDGDRRSLSESHPGAVSPPKKPCAPDAFLYPGGPTAAAHASSAGQGDSALSLPPSAPSSERARRRSHRCHHHHHYAMRHDGASRAVSVHVPFDTESPVVNNPRGSSGNRHANAQDLFTIHEVIDAARRGAGSEAQPIQRQQQPPPREEAEASCLSRQPIEESVEGSTARTNTNSSSTTPTVEPKKTSWKGGNEGGNDDAEGAEEPICRICREGNDVAPLIAPCGCTGSVRFVHASCLDRWRLESAKRNMANVNHCEICKMVFTVNIQRSTLLWESSQHILRCICFFLTCVSVVVLTTTLTHGIFGELSCLAYYHKVAYGTMFRFEGLSLSLFIYGLAVLLVLFGNLIVYSWFRSRREVEEYVEEMHIIPPFYTRRNMILIVLVCVLLLAQVHATGFLMKYFLYNTSHIVWTWETSPLVGGILFALFTTCSITVCSWGRQMYMSHVVNRSNGQHPAEDVVVENIGHNNGDSGAAPTAPASPPAATAGAIIVPTSATLSYHTSYAPSSPQSNDNNDAIPSSLGGLIDQNCALGTASPLQAPHHLSPRSPLPLLRAEGTPQPPDPDVTYTRYFQVPPDQRVIRAFEYCPPHRKVPK